MDVHNGVIGAVDTISVSNDSSSIDALKNEWLGVDTSIKSKSLNELIVDIGKCYLTSNPIDVVSCLGLGSCVGVVLYDSKTKITGVAHVMLPSKSSFQKGTLDDAAQRRFADVAIPYLIDSMIKMGSNINDIRAKIAGGAQMFKGVVDEDLMDIGKRNVIAVKEQLSLKKIPLISEHVHGCEGRTMRYMVGTSRLIVRTRSGYAAL